MLPGFPTFTGRKTIESFYRNNFAAGTIRSVEFHPKDRHVGANSVREHGTYKISVIPKNEAEALMPSPGATSSSVPSAPTANGKSSGKSTPSSPKSL